MFPSNPAVVVPGEVGMTTAKGSWGSVKKQTPIAQLRALVLLWQEETAWARGCPGSLGPPSSGFELRQLSRLGSHKEGWGGLPFLAKMVGVL